MRASEVNVDLTGNPFVDTGLAVLAALAGLDDIRTLTVDAVTKVHGDGSQLASWNSQLKNFTMIFTKNSLLTNPSMKDSDLRVRIYVDILHGLLSDIGREGLSRRCEACGAARSVDFNSLCRRALKGRGVKEQVRFVGRDWFPLSGSLGSDAQALPAASRPVHLCATCLFAVHYLPLGMILLEGRLAVFQSTSVELWYELVRDIVIEVQSRIKADNYATIGAKEGSRAVAKRLLALFERLQGAARFGDIPQGTTLQVWRFTNSGASPECKIQEIPNPALVFLWGAVRQGLRQEVESLIDHERKKESFFRCITERRDYFGLYPRGKRQGASPKLFTLYQTQVCGRSPHALVTARNLARQLKQGLTPRDLKRLQREEAFFDGAARNQVRRLMTQLAEEGKFSHTDYLELFPLREDGPGIHVSCDGWNIIRYYLHHSDAFEPPSDGRLATATNPDSKLTMLQYYALIIFQHYQGERGLDRFRKEALGRLGRSGSGIRWLRGQFLVLGEEDSNFTYGGWEALCKNDRGQFVISELLFQMRLLWSEWIRGEGPAAVAPTVPQKSGLPMSVERRLRTTFSQYVERRGLDRFHRDVLLRLRRRELGILWFKRQLTRKEDEGSTKGPISEDEWEDFLKDEEGRSCAEERLFQMHLVLANLYQQANKP